MSGLERGLGGISGLVGQAAAGYDTPQTGAWGLEHCRCYYAPVTTVGAGFLGIHTLL